MAFAAHAATRGVVPQATPRCSRHRSFHGMKPQVLPCKVTAGPERARRGMRRSREAIGGNKQRLRAQGDGGGGKEEEKAGDEDLQDTLVDILNLQLQFQKVKETVSEESAKLTETAEMLKEEIDRTRQESQESNDTAFEEAMEELDRISLEAEQELKAKSVFRDLAGSQDDIAAWEAQMEEERSAGQFFKQLYVNPERAKNARTSNAAATKEEMKAKAAEVRSEVNKQLRNPARMLIYAFLATVTSIAAIEDALTDKPAWGRIGLYVAIAVALGVTATQEAKYLREQLEIEEGDDESNGRGK